MRPSFPRVALDSPKAGADPVATISTIDLKIAQSVAEASAQRNFQPTGPDRDRARVSYRRIESVPGRARPNFPPTLTVPGQASASYQRATRGQVKVCRSCRPIELGPDKALRNYRPTEIG
jgi:hypothetical protein